MRWLILGAVFLLAVINFADKTVIGLSAVPIMNDLQLNYEQWGIVGSSFFWLFSVAGIVGAALSDRFGTEKMLLIMAIIWTIAQSITVFAAGLPFLIMTRVLLGAGEGPFFATAVSHLSKWFAPESRGFAISILNLGNTVGKAVSVPILIWLITQTGWKMTFLFLGGVSLLFVFIWLWLGRLQAPHTVEQTSAKTKIVWTDVRKTIFSPTFVFTTMIAFIGYSVITFSLVFSPTYITEVKGISPSVMGYMKATAGATGAILSVGLSAYSDFIFKRSKNIWLSRVLFTSICAALAGIVFFFFTITESVALMTLILILENGLIMLIFTLGPQVVNSLMPERKGLMSGIMMGLATTSGIIAPIIFGKVIDASGDSLTGFNGNIQAMAILLIISAVLFALFARPAQKEIIPGQHNMGIHLK
ncbi:MULTISPECIES: MFS transporter [unclassified Niallia]|uniref:MFS transporter n=2 Tax=Bacteria TaxID=2 RepID=UPI001EDADBB7|nr:MULTISPECIES: MFS transporter [unclassified Niallia]MDL0434705.1 MFS transporter [Niallia sp. SS-2023]UPO85979.1 MFS transporter [Niallia sp. Man26]